MRIIDRFFIPFLFVAGAASLCSGSFIVSSVSRDSLFIGDRIQFRVTMLVPKGSQIVPPATDNGFGKFVVKEWTTGKTEIKSADSSNFNYVITTYSTENCTIPSLDYYVTSGTKVDTLRTQLVPMRIMLVSFPDTAKIKDLKPQQSAGVPSLAWLWMLLALIIIAVIIVLVRRYRRKKAAPVEAPLAKPPYEEAIEALDLLEAKQYIAKGLFREYAFELSEIAKRYIERRFEVHAVEFTTEEILSWARVSTLEPSHRKILDWFFTTTDPVKFAKLIPDIDTAYRFGKDVRGFIEATRPMEAGQGKKEMEQPHAM